jgi:hypothetical protein
VLAAIFGDDARRQYRAAIGAAAAALARLCGAVYAYAVQQTLVWRFGPMVVFPSFLLRLGLTMLLAMLSWPSRSRRSR